MNFDITIIMLERLVKNSTIVLKVTVGMLVFLTEVFHQVLFYFQIYLVCALRSYQEKRKIHQKLGSSIVLRFSAVSARQDEMNPAH